MDYTKLSSNLHMHAVTDVSYAYTTTHTPCIHTQIIIIKILTKIQTTLTPVILLAPKEKKDMIAHTYILARGRRQQNHLQFKDSLLYTKFQNDQGYIARPSLKKRRGRQSKHPGPRSCGVHFLECRS